MNIVEFLSKVDMFSSLGSSFLEQIGTVMTRLDLPKGKMLLRQGDPGDSMFLIVAGELEIFVKDADTGVEISIVTMGPFQYVGEMSLLTGDPRSANARAVKDTVVLQLTQERFDRIIEKIPAVPVALARLLAKRVGQASRSKGIDFVDIGKFRFDPSVYKLLPARVLQKHQAVPLALAGQVLTVAMVNPNDLVALDDLRRMARGHVIQPVAISNADYEKWARAHGFDRIRQATTSIQPRIARPIEYTTDIEAPLRTAEQMTGEAVIKLFDQVVNEALDLDASDIHIEPRAHAVDVRYRVDGKLRHRQERLPRNAAAPLVSRIKILAGLDISEKRMPQDGRIGLIRDDARYDLRVASLPTADGEKLALRILDPTALMGKLDRIIVTANACQVVRSMLAQPHGLFLVTGPTGSGKTTTLDAALGELNDEQTHIVTAEDPVEYSLPGVNQTQVQPAIGLDFSALVRAFVRQDPNVIMVGETRDTETAKVSTEAALTGHLVLTSLHTNDALSAVLRLREMDLEPFLIANTLLGVIAQRLVRRLCPSCKTGIEIDGASASRLERVLGSEQRTTTFFEGSGCDACNGSGYRGRVAVFEILRVNDRLRSMIAAEVPTDQLTEEALRGNMVPMRNYCDFLLGAGLTTVEEVVRILPELN